MRPRPGGKAALGGAVPITIYYTAQDDPRKNTAVRLARAGAVTLVEDARKLRHHTVLLNPFAKKALSREDLMQMRRNGLLALDCSWAQAQDMFPLLQGKVRSRALPFLVAANPARFGTPFELSTAEAIAAALWIVGEERQARRVMASLPWGERFFEVNARPLADYAACTTSAEVVEAQMAYLD